MGNVDGLSRLLLDVESQVEEIQTINFQNFSNELPVTFEKNRERTKVDPMLSVIYDDHVISGLPIKNNFLVDLY